MTPPPRGAKGARGGLVAGVCAYLLWGVMPVYFPLLEPATPLPISAHRVVWSWVVCMLLLIMRAEWRTFIAVLRHRALMARLTLAAVLLASNWLIFLIGVMSGRVVEAALGYFMNPSSQWYWP